jgi:TonB family protein
MLGLCIAGTRVAVHTVKKIVADTTLFYLPRLTAPAVDKPQVAGRLGGGGGHGTGEGLIISANPPPRGFQVVAAVGAIPTEIPPIEPGAKALDPRDFTGRGEEGGVGWGVVGGTGPADQVPVEFKNALYSAETVDVRFIPAELVVKPTFHYPQVLVEAGIPGRAVVQFVIDTIGDVEPGSVRILEQTHQAFADAARAGVLEARFTPARYGTRLVRQLSKWPVKFTLASR